MAKSDFYPKEGVVYECYKGFTDDYGDRARRGQKFVFFDNDNEDVILERASGRGVNIKISKDKFAAHFAPAATSEKEATAAPTAAKEPLDVEAYLITGTWEDVKEHMSELPKYIQDLLKRAKPELFEAPKPKVFEFKQNGNTFGTSAFYNSFYVGNGLVSEKDKMKSLIVSRGWKAELFEGLHGHQCIRFVEDK